jgi:CheY-like chemotaxis protein
VKILLKRIGKFSVFESATVPDAIGILKSEKVDIVLSDINLDTDLNGYDLLKDARGHLGGGRFYFVSASSKAVEEEKAMKAGADGYFQVPISEEELRKVVGRLN